MNQRASQFQAQALAGGRKMEIKKFDPVVRQHVLYKEGKIK